jgi:ribonuclease BN (tRNA processing enzyme)
MKKISSLLSVILTLALVSMPSFAAAPPQPNTEPYWTILGVAGGPIIHGNDAMSAHALVAGDDTYLFDMGYGAVRQLAKAGIPLASVKAVFITHHHPDHNADLSFFLVSKWLFGGRKPIEIYGPQGTKALVEGLIKANAPTVLASFPVSGDGNISLSDLITIKEVPVGTGAPQTIFHDDKVNISTIEVDHYQVAPSVKMSDFPDALAYRAAVTHGRTYMYTGDTGATQNLLKLAQGVDVLISEVIDVPGIDRKLRSNMKNAPAGLVSKILENLEKNHLVPNYIGELAVQSNVKEVVLTHFVPPIEQEADAAKFKDGVSAVYKGPVKIGQELGRY